MPNKFVTMAASLVAAMAMASAANAVQVTVKLYGVLQGEIYGESRGFGTRPQQEFLITLVGDTSNIVREGGVRSELEFESAHITFYVHGGDFVDHTRFSVDTDARTLTFGSATGTRPDWLVLQYSATADGYWDWYRGCESCFGGPPTTVLTNNLLNIETTRGAFTVDRVEDGVYAFSNAFGLPEPTSWATMVLGFGATGALIRRRRIPPAGRARA